MKSPDELSAELSKRGMVWADKDAAFKALDDATKSILSECIADLNDVKSNADAETKARRSKKFLDHLEALRSARREANRAKVSYDTYKEYIALLKEQEWSRRAEAKFEAGR